MNRSDDAFITDMGESLGGIMDGQKFDLERYGVWKREPCKGNRHQVVEVGNDLSELKLKHGVENDRVIPIRDFKTV